MVRSRSTVGSQSTKVFIVGVGILLKRFNRFQDYIRKLLSMISLHVRFSPMVALTAGVMSAIQIMQ